MTPHNVHYGHAHAMRITRQATLDAAFEAHPKRFKSKCPQPPALPTAAWINPLQQPPSTSRSPTQ